MLALPSTLEAAKAAAEPPPFTPHVPYALLLAGAAGILVGVIAILRSLSRRVTGRGQPKSNGWASTLLVGPCGGSVTTGTCLSAHPDFYQQDASGSFFDRTRAAISPARPRPGLG